MKSSYRDSFLYWLGACAPGVRSTVWCISLTVVGIAAWFVVIQPSEDNRSNLMRRRLSAEQARERLAEVRMRTTKLQATIQRQQRFLDDVEHRRLPQSTLFKKLAKLTGRGGVEVVAAESPHASNPGGQVSGIRITVAGTFREIVSFLHEVSTGSDMPALSSYLLRPAPEAQSPDILRLECVLSASGWHVS